MGKRTRSVVSPASLQYVIDNTVVSTLHQAGALSRVLELWLGKWFVPLHVRDESARWPTEGSKVIRILEDLRARQVLSYVAVAPHKEAVLFARLNRILGEGESAAIAIAYHHRIGAALDDRTARAQAERLSPPVPWIATEEILSCAVNEGLLSASDAGGIWAATGILDPLRYVSVR